MTKTWRLPTRTSRRRTRSLARNWWLGLLQNEQCLIEDIDVANEDNSDAVNDKDMGGYRQEPQEGEQEVWQGIGG